MLKSQNKIQMESKEEGYTEVFVWGADRHGQLGLGNKQTGRFYPIPKLCTFNVLIIKISCGEEHSAFITSHGSVYTMGSNASGRLGIGDRSVKLSATPCLVEGLAQIKAIDLSCGWGHTAVISDVGSIFTWGVGEYGALGISQSITQYSPIQINFKEQIPIKSVSCGTRHTAMVDSKGRLFVCGAGDAGQLGINTLEQQSIPIQVLSVKEIISAACGVFHTLILNSSGKVFAMGGNKSGQLGIGNKENTIIPIQVKGLERVIKIACGNISAAVTEEGVIYVWGTGTFGEYLVPTVLEGIKVPVRKVEVAGNFGVTIDNEGNVYSWGTNSRGELGLGDFEVRNQGCQVISLQGKGIKEISCGCSYVIALGKTIANKYTPLSQVKDFKSDLEKELEGAFTKAKIKKTFTYKPTEDQYENLMAVYEKEQQQYNNLKKRLIELQNNSKKANKNFIQDNIRGEQLKYAESQLNREKEKCSNLLKEYESEKARIDSFNLEQIDLELRIKELEDIAEKLKRENTRQSTQGTIKVSTLLKDYEDRMEHEIEGRRKITKEKATEIHLLQDEVNNIENVIMNLQSEKAKMSNLYIEEINSIELKVNEKKRLLDRKTIEKEELIGLKSRDDINIQEIEEKLAKINDSVKEYEKSLKIILNELEDAKKAFEEKKLEINKVKETDNDLLAHIRVRANEYERELSEGKQRERENMKELRHYQELFEEKCAFNKKLEGIIIDKVAEIEELNREVNSWLENVNEARKENTTLKKLIEEFEVKNKKIMESMNLHIYNRAADYKERTIRALRTLPYHEDKLRVSEYRSKYVTPSPKRLNKIIQEEKNTRKGSSIPEDSNIVKSNHMLIQMLDDYPKKFNEKEKIRENYATPEIKVQIDTSKKEVIGSLTQLRQSV